MGSHKLKYKDGITSSGCGVCPPSHCQVVNKPLQAIRFGHGRKPTSRDFVPQALEKPQRLLNASHEKKCSLHALSFYRSAAEARATLQYLRSTSRKFKTNWTALLQTQIGPNDGLVSEADSNGHFDLHEFVQAALENQSSFFEDL